MYMQVFTDVRFLEFEVIGCGRYSAQVVSTSAAPYGALRYLPFHEVTRKGIFTFFSFNCNHMEN